MELGIMELGTGAGLGGEMIKDNSLGYIQETSHVVYLALNKH